MAFQVYDDILPEIYSDNIRKVLCSEPNELTDRRLPWFYNNDIVGNEDEPDTIDNFQFTHVFYQDHTFLSDFSFVVHPILEFIKPKALLRIKANMIPRSCDHFLTGYHTDYDFECKTAVYYVNTNNGYTVFESGERVDAVQGRLLTFDSLDPHSSVTATDEKVRVVINFNYF